MAIAAVSPRMVVAAAAAFLLVHLVTAQAPRNHGKREDGLGQSVGREPHGAVLADVWRKWLLENDQRHPRVQSEKKNCTAAKYIRGCFIQGVKTNLCQKTTTALQPSTSIQSCPRCARSLLATLPPPSLP